MEFMRTGRDGSMMLMLLFVAGLLAQVSPLIPEFTDNGVNETRREPLPKSGSSHVISFQKFCTEEEMREYTEYLQNTYPELVTKEEIGRSVEGRPIELVMIRKKSKKRKPIILIDAGIHAREWASPAVALYTIHQLVEHYKENEVLLDKADWFIIPLLNPDGYCYSMTKDRMWRKNRANTSLSSCKGVDLNRNFDVFFGGLGTSTNPCSETYTGTGPFSEPETNALKNLALRYKGRIKLYLTLHSFGKYMLYPWGFGSVLPTDWEDLDKLAKVAMAALSSIHGTRYTIGSSTNILGPAAGGSDDWMKARIGTKYSYTVELPGGGGEGFDLPPEKILYISTEMFEAIKAAALYISKEYPVT